MAFPTGWGYKVALTIDADSIDSTLTNWTLVFDQSFLSVLTQVNGPLDADGTKASLNGGGDVRFSSDEEGSTRLACDIRDWTTNNTPANATCEVAVKVPSVSSSVDTTIYMWWGKSGESQPSVSDTYGQYNAYDSATVGVWTFDEDPSSGTYYDRTSNQTNLTHNGTASQVSGQLGNAVDFTSGYGEEESPSTALILDETDFSLLFVCSLDTPYTTQPAWAGMVCMGNTANKYSFQRAGTSDGFVLYAQSGNAGISNIYEDMCTGSFEMLSWRGSSTTIYAYKNKSLLGSKTATIDFGTETDHFQIMKGRSATATPTSGIADECRIYNTDKGVDWLNATYDNIFNTSGFLTAGSIQDVTVSEQTDWKLGPGLSNRTVWELAP